MPPRPNIRVLRDTKARQGVLDNEIARRAYLYVARNQTLPAQVRYRAQLQLNTFGRYTRPTTVKNRCTVTGRGRGVIGEFGLCRVRFLFSCLGGTHFRALVAYTLDSTSFG
jgi:small subunit ribosomal protein S14